MSARALAIETIYFELCHAGLSPSGRVQAPVMLNGAQNADRAKRSFRFPASSPTARTTTSAARSRAGA